MGDKTKIAWADSTWNPLQGTKGRWHCTKVSPGCQHCYAERMNIRFGGPPFKKGADTLRLETDNHALLWQPLQIQAKAHSGGKLTRKEVYRRGG